MKKMKISALTVLFIVSIMAVAAYASDYQGNEKEESKSIFQKIGDLFTGNYVVKNEPVKQVGVFNVMADQVNQMKLSSSDIYENVEKK
jgi:hypothetical protein